MDNFEEFAEQMSAGNTDGYQSENLNVPSQQQVENKVTDTASDVSLVSSDMGADVVNQGKEYLDEVAPYTSAQYNKDLAAETVDPAEPIEPVDEAIEEGGYTFEEAFELFGKDFTGVIKKGDKYYPDASAIERLGITGITEDAGSQLETEVEKIDDTIENIVGQFNNLNLENDPIFAQQNQVIRNQFEQLRRKMQDTNKRREAAINTLNIRTGGQRYASDIAMGIVQEEVNQGILRISDINNAEAQAISQARMAYEQGEYSKFAQQIDGLQLLRNNKMSAIDNLNKKASEANKQAQQEFDNAVTLEKISQDAEQIRLGQERFERTQGLTETKFQIELDDKAKQGTLDNLYNLAEGNYNADLFMDEEKNEFESKLGLMPGSFDIFYNNLYQKARKQETMDVLEMEKMKAGIANTWRLAQGIKAGGGSGVVDETIMPTNINEAIQISSQQLVKMRDSGTLNDLVYDQYIRGLMVDWEIPTEREEEVRSMLNQSMEGIKQEEDISSDFETGEEFQTKATTDFETGSAQAGEALRQGTGKIAENFWPTVSKALIGVSSNINNFFRGIIGAEELSEEEINQAKEILTQ